MSPEEAILIIRGWLENGTELLLSATMINFSVLSKCRVVSIDGGAVTLWPSKDDAVFSFTVDSPHVRLKYSELREFRGKPGLESVSEEMLSKSALVVALELKELDPLAPLRMDVERIMLIEL